MTPDAPFQRESSSHQPTSIAVTQAFEAANALTALATRSSLGASMQSPPQSQHSPTTTPKMDSYRHNSIGAPVGVPIEPTPDILQEPLTRSPTLEQYHHGSRSPEEKRRRESLAARNSPPLILAPLQNLSGAPVGQAENALGLFQGPITAAPANRLVSAPNGDQTNFIKSERSTQPGQSHSPPQIKQDPDSNLNLTAGSQSPAPKRLDADTKAAIQAVQNEHGLRGGKKKQTPQPTADEEAAPVTTPKKRPPPKSASKKGVAKKPPTKKRKVDNDGANSVSRQSATPPKSTKASIKASGKKAGSKSATPALGSSPRAASVQEEDDDDDGGSEEDNEVYCICRRKDDHSWMIACDGGCDDWFHGKCVQMKEEDGPLIDKYICPNCQKKSDAVTTWKPMCRMGGCRNPARVAKSNASKYCSDECGVKFMRMMTARTKEAHNAGTKKNKAKRKHRDEGMSSEEEEDLGPRGGMLRLGEVKSLATGATDIDSFRRLGHGVLSPPPSATENTDSKAKQNGDDEALQHTSLLPNEKSRLTAIVEEKDAMRTRMALLKDREKFVAMAKEQVLRYAEREKLKPKDICGFDSRLSWSEAEFGRWRQSTAGVAALESGMLELPDGIPAESKEHNGEAQTNGDGDVDMKLNGDTNTENDGHTNNASAALGSDNFCAKKRCEKHKQWQKITLQDVRFDESELADRMRALEREERDVKERGMLRWRKERALGKGQNGVEVVAV